MVKKITGLKKSLVKPGIKCQWKWQLFTLAPQSWPYKLLWASHHHLCLSAQMYLNDVNQRCEVKSSLWVYSQYLSFTCLSSAVRARRAQADLNWPPSFAALSQALLQLSLQSLVLSNAVLKQYLLSSLALALLSVWVWSPNVSLSLSPVQHPSPNINNLHLLFQVFLFTDISQRQITCSPHSPGGCGVWSMNLSPVLILKGRYIEYVRMKDF